MNEKDTVITYKNMYKQLASGDKKTMQAVIVLIDTTLEVTLARWLGGDSENADATKAYLKYLKALKWNIENAKEQYKGLKKEMDTLNWMTPEWLNDDKDPHQALNELVYDRETPIKPHKGGK